MNNLPTEVILNILNLLPRELDKFSFSFMNKWNWKICSLPTTHVLKLESTITALQLRRYCTVTLQNRYFDKTYIQHFFLNAVNLHTIILDNRENCTIRYILFLLESLKKYQKVTIIVPEKFERKFKFIAEEEEMEYITIKSVTDSPPIDVTKIVTPESVRVEVERVKNILKYDYYIANKESTVMKNNLGHIVASAINRFFNSKEYCVWENDFKNNQQMLKTDLDINEASSIIDEHGPKLIESVVILGNHWFLMTSFSCFIHNNKQVDDCADLSQISYQKKPMSFIRRKTRFGKDYFELTFRFGFVELLATSGFFGSVDGAFFSAFLGSAIQELPNNITDNYETISSDVIFISKIQKRYIRKNRIINQYYKKSAKFDWGFYSQKFEESGFSPANPLEYKSLQLMHSAASFVLKSFTFEKVEERKLDELMSKILELEDSSLSSMKKLVKKYLVLLNEYPSSFFSLSPRQETKKDLIEIYNNILAGALKSTNAKQIKLAKKRYIAKKINLFEED